MKKALLLSAITFGFFTTACTGSGFLATLKDGVDSKTVSAVPVGKGQDSTTEPIPGQPGAGTITLGGVLISEKDQKLQVNSQITLNQAAAVAQSPDISHLDQIESRTDFVQLGCNTSSAPVINLTKGLTESKITADDPSGTLAIKAKLVVICGKNNLPASFVTIVADQLAMIEASYQLSTNTGAGFLAAYVNKLTLTGKNDITTKALESNNFVSDAPSITVLSQQSLEGQGSLELKTIGGKQTATAKK